MRGDLRGKVTGGTREGPVELAMPLYFPRLRHAGGTWVDRLACSDKLWLGLPHLL